MENNLVLFEAPLVGSTLNGVCGGMGDDHRGPVFGDVPILGAEVIPITCYLVHLVSALRDLAVNDFRGEAGTGWPCDR